jgi:hypothetical protein
VVTRLYDSLDEQHATRRGEGMLVLCDRSVGGS